MTAVLLAWADQISEAPALLTAMNWLALGRNLDQLPESSRNADSTEVRTLRERIAQQYAASFDEIFDSPQAEAELGDFDRVTAMLLLLGPLATARLSTLSGVNCTETVRATVEGFLHVYGKPVTSTSTEPEGA